MKALIALLCLFAVLHSAADDRSKELDRKLILALLEQADVVVLCHNDVSGNVGMDARMKTRYGLIPGQSTFGLPVKETIVGPAVTNKVIVFWAGRRTEQEPYFLPQGEYLLFLRHDAKQDRWSLVADFMGLQLCTKGLDSLVREVAASRPK